MKNIILGVILISLSSCYRCMDCQIYDDNGNFIIERRECGFSEKHIKEKIDKNSSFDLDHDSVICR